MKRFVFRGDWLVELLLAVAVAVGVFVAANVWKTPGIKSVAPAINPFFLLRPHSVTEEVIDGYVGVRRVYEFDMAKAPDNKGRGRSLFVYLRHTIAQIEIDGHIYADTGESTTQRHIGRTPGNYWLTLQIVGAVELHGAALWYGIGAASLHLVALFGQKPNRSELFWLLPTFLALSADLVIFLRCGSISGAPVLLVWIIVNLFVWGFGSLRVALRQARELHIKDEELRGARMQTLINQIRPHFIYNTLAAIHMLCADDPKRSMQIIADFSDYLHANFNALAATEPIAFIKELEHTRAYLDVEMARYEEKLSVEYHTDYITFSLPPLTLQPIVENCVKHGVGNTHRPMHIIVTTRAADGGAEIIVEDNGVGYEPTPDGALHVGLRNVRERLEMMCNGTLDIAPRPGGGTVVTVFVPKERKA